MSENLAGVTILYPELFLWDIVLIDLGSHFLVFVCVEILRPSQLSGVLSSAGSLPNYTFTGQA